MTESRCSLIEAKLPVTTIFDAKKAKIALQVAKKMGIGAEIIAEEGDPYQTRSGFKATVEPGKVFLQVEYQNTPQGLSEFWKAVDKKVARAKR